MKFGRGWPKFFKRTISFDVSNASKAIEMPSNRLNLLLLGDFSLPKNLFGTIKIFQEIFLPNKSFGFIRLR